MKIGKIKPVPITEEMKKSYLDYAMSVIVARALPDIRDGLKPVHRRIFYAMQQMGQTHSAPYTKSAKVVGECFVKNTMVLTEKGLMPIQELKVGERVYTQNGIKKITQLYEIPKKPLLKITLESGISNIVTPSQKFKVLTSEWKFKWKKAKDLFKNDYLVIKVDYPEIKNLVELKGVRNNQPRYLNENMAYLLGLFVSDGSIPNDYSAKKLPRINFGLGDEKKIAEKVVSIFKKEFNYSPTIEETNYKIKVKNGEVLNNKRHTIRINRKAINEFFVANFSLKGVKAPTKKIPLQIFRSPPSVIFSFISGLIDGDGSVDIKKNRIRYVSVSKQLIDKLLILLFHLGIFSSISQQVSNKSSFIKNREVKHRYKGWELTVYGKNAIRLAEKLTLASFQKRKRAQQLTKNKKRNVGFQYDIIPYAGKILFRELSNSHLGGGWYQDINDNKFRSGIKYPGGRKIRYSSDLWEKPLRKSQIIDWGIKDKLEQTGSLLSEFLHHITEDKIYFLKLSSIKKVAPEKTYDIEVENDHEFIANGMVSHNCMGKYHPHGDMPIYDALVRLAQDFSMRYPLVDGQGNFGSIDGDPAAAMRYTEVRMAKITAEMLTDLEKETVDFIDNFDSSLQEPIFLPAKLPNLLLMGSDGIAVGMATRIPPHNLGEVINAIRFMIEKGKVVLPEEEVKGKEKFEIKKIKFEDFESPVTSLQSLVSSFESEATVEDLMKFIKGPDFPTGGEIYNQEEIIQAYTTGKGKILMRAKATIEESKRRRYQIVVSELPYQVNKASLVAKIAHLVKEKKIKGIGSLRDESDRQGLRIVLDLKKTARPKAVLNSLYKYTPMQTTYPANMVALVDGTPQTLNLKQILIEFISHRQRVITRRSLFELREAKKRAHILEGLKIALANLDAVIRTIKRSRDVDTARANLIKKFSLTEIQANAILEMQLRRLAALERKKIEDEYKEIGRKIISLTELLEKPEKILTVIKKDLRELEEKYADPRRTRVYKQSLEKFSEADTVSSEDCLITVTKTGYIKRLPIGTYRAQRRGGKGVSGMTTKEADEITQLFTANTHDNIFFFTNRGRVFAIRAWELPEGSRTSRGQAVINLINLDQGEIVQSVLNLKEGTKKGFLFMATRKGTVKKTSLANFANIRSSGLIAIKLSRGDELCWVKPTSGKNHILLVSRLGKSIHFAEADVRPMGRDTMGVRGIRLKKGDYVIGTEVFPAKERRPKDKRRSSFCDVLVVMENGLGKRSAIKEYPLQKRGGIGVKAANVTKKTGKIVASQLVSQKVQQVILTSKKAQVIKLPLRNIPRLGRDTQGVILMRFSKKGDQVAAVTCLGK